MMTDDEIAAEQALIKEQARDVRVRDLLHPDNYTDSVTAESRLEVCRGCERLFKPTLTCRECGCFMAAKTRLSAATCPLGKW
jgi:hypothetical protein